MITKSCFVLAVVLTACISQRTLAVVIPTEKIREIIQHEENLISALGNYIQEENEKENDIDKAIQSFHLSAQEENLSFNTNPVDIFRLHRRVVDGWDEVLEKILCEDCVRNNGSDDMERALYKCHRRSMWPREADVTDAAMALIRLCRVYNLNLDDVINGQLGDTNTATLTYDDILFIADTAVDNGFLYETVHWLKAGIAKAKKSQPSKEMVIKLYRELAGAYYQAKMPSQSLKYIQECAGLYPESKSVKRELQYYKQRTSESSSKGDNTELTPHLVTRAVTACERLCRGEGEKLATRPLFCRLRSTSSPFNVVREEIVSWKPRVVIVHQVLDQQEIEYFENISPDTVERSGNLPWTHGTPVFDTGKEADEDNRMRVRLMEKIANLTGLDTKHTLRATNLGLGENIRVRKNVNHLNTYNPYLYSQRFYNYPIARWIYFLTDTVGGDIAFPDLNIRIPSIKGNAVYWYKLKPTGEPEMRNRYCACPSLLGSPWVVAMDLSIPKKLERTFCGLTRKSAYHS